MRDDGSEIKRLEEGCDSNSDSRRLCGLRVESGQGKVSEAQLAAAVVLTVYGNTGVRDSMRSSLFITPVFQLGLAIARGSRAKVMTGFHVRDLDTDDFKINKLINWYVLFSFLTENAKKQFLYMVTAVIITWFQSARCIHLSGHVIVNGQNLPISVRGAPRCPHRGSGGIERKTIFSFEKPPCGCRGICW